MQRDLVLNAEVSPSAENAPFLRVVWCRRPFAAEAGPVLVDVRRLQASVPGKLRRRLPKDRYPRADLHCLLPSCGDTREIGLGLKLEDDTVLRVRLSAADANLLQSGLEADYALRNGVQSCSSSGSANVDGSVMPGQSQ